jgi:class 3 adenylate cyclase
MFADIVGRFDSLIDGSLKQSKLTTFSITISCTIIGFTAWSSTREPFKVFQLLETIYGEFDALAKKRRVFKVETVGDCYVSIWLVPSCHGLSHMAHSHHHCLFHSCRWLACRWPFVAYLRLARIMPLSWLDLPATAMPRCVSSPTS